MTRGIHLKQLKKEDLVALGLPESALEELETAEPPWIEHATATQRRAVELARELRTELEVVLKLLGEALEGIDYSPAEGQIPGAEEAPMEHDPLRGALASANPWPPEFEQPRRCLKQDLIIRSSTKRIP